MHWLITGADGFLGASVAEWLMNAGHTVAGVTRGATISPEVQRIITPAAANEFAQILREETPDCVLHAAGAASVEGSWSDPGKDFHSSVVVWHELLEAIRISGERPRVIFPSSAAVYGNPDHLPVAEDAPRRPISPYGFHKLICEQLGEEYAVLYGIPLIVARLFSVFGPRQRRLLVWELADQILSDSATIRLQGTGLEERDYLGIADVAEIFELLGGQAKSSGLQVINVGSGRSIRVLDLVAMFQRFAGSDKPVECAKKTRPGDPVHWRADNRRLREWIPEWRPGNIEKELVACLEAWQPQTVLK